MIVPIRLVDHHEMGEFKNPFLHSLELIASSGDGENNEAINHGANQGLTLADTHRLNKDGVVTRSLTQCNRLAGPPSHTSQKSAAW